MRGLQEIIKMNEKAVNGEERTARAQTKSGNILIGEEARWDLSELKRLSEENWEDCLRTHGQGRFSINLRLGQLKRKLEKKNHRVFRGFFGGFLFSKWLKTVKKATRKPRGKNLNA